MRVIARKSKVVSDHSLISLLLGNKELKQATHATHNHTRTHTISRAHTIGGDAPDAVEDKP